MPIRPLIAVVALLTVMALAGCRSDQPVQPATPSPTARAGRSPEPAAPTRAGGTLRYGLSTDPGSIDPRFVADDEGTVVVDALFDSLVALNRQLRVVPAAAAEWEIREDGRVFEFRLREDASFHDGSPVTAADFVRSFNRIADGTAEPRSFLAYQLEPIAGFEDTQRDGSPLAGVEAVDDLTLRITLAEPFPEFLGMLARPGLAPVPAAAEEDPERFAESPIGNGPFRVAEPWQRNQFIRVARFAQHWDEPAYLDEVVFRIYANDPAQELQYADLEAGQLQVAEIPAGRRQAAVERFGLSADGYSGPGVLDGISSTIYYYGFNTERPPFDDPDVRRAFSLLIDREVIAREVMHDTRVPADAIVPPSIPGHQEDACRYCIYDPDEAASLLEAAGADLSGVTILHNTGTTHEAIARRIAQDVRGATGFEVDTRAEELQEFVAAIRTGDVGVFRLGWQADYPSPGAYLSPLFAIESVGVDNLSRYAEPEVDELLRRARAATDEDERIELYRQAERRILEDAAIAPILYYRHNKVVAPGVRDLVVSPLGTVDLSAVWLERSQ